MLCFGQTRAEVLVIVDMGQEEREVRYSLRLPPDLHAALVELARREDRSLNQQLIHMLREGVRRDVHRRSGSRPGDRMPRRRLGRPGAGEPDY